MTCPFDHELPAAAGAANYPATSAPTALLDPESRADATELFAALRHRGAVTYLPEEGYWVVTGYENCLEIYNSPERFSSQYSVSPNSAFRGTPAALEVLRTSRAGARARTLITTDPPDHARYRKVMQRALEPGKFMRQITPRIQEIVSGLLDRAEAAGRFDAVSDYAVHLPIRVVAAALDVPESDVALLKSWADDFFAIQVADVDEAQAVQAAHSVIAMETYFLAKFDHRRADPLDDFLGRLVEVVPDAAPLTDAELLNLVLQIIVGGTESTTNFLGSLIDLLLRTDGLMDYLRENPARIPPVVEEALRYASPLAGSFRTAVGDQEIGGTAIPGGARIMVAIASANRDECPFGDGEFDAHRDMRTAPHVTFGRGIHACIGQQLARRESQLTVQGLVERFPSLHLDSDAPPERLDVFTVNGFRELPVVIG